MPLDLGTITAELRLREKKITELTADKTKLKQLLKKAKDALDSLNTKYKGAQEQARAIDARLREALDRNRDLA
jgi:chromosome segregation ATPase